MSEPLGWLEREDIIVATDVSPDDHLHCGVTTSRMIVSFLAAINERDRDEFINHIVDSIRSCLLEHVKRMQAEKVH